MFQEKTSKVVHNSAQLSDIQQENRIEHQNYGRIIQKDQQGDTSFHVNRIRLHT